MAHANGAHVAPSASSISFPGALDRARATVPAPARLARLSAPRGRPADPTIAFLKAHAVFSPVIFLFLRKTRTRTRGRSAVAQRKTRCGHAARVMAQFR